VEVDKTRALFVLSRLKLMSKKYCFSIHSRPTGHGSRLITTVEQLLIAYSMYPPLLIPRKVK